ncbi:MAG: site-2 protease family protein [Firmicutes bacterium]|jgi:Zn-dependent protease|nr:site-2 protease family protein [Bacillota bacterium]MCL5012411.1 site-2 protease family protein [Bacillota bacterium]
MESNDNPRIIVFRHDALNSEDNREEDPGTHKVSPPPRRKRSWTNAIVSFLGVLYKAKVFLLFGSLIFSMIVYGLAFGWAFGIGLALIIAIHETGHVLANKKKHLDASWPMFIPFLGAIINLRQMPRNADDEAFIGIAGPIFGLGATLISLGLYESTHIPVFRWLALFGFFMHIFNLMPIVPLDGGRTVSFLGWRAWIMGLIGLLVLLFYNPFTGRVLIDPLTIIILAFIIWSFIGRVRHGPGRDYNAIPLLHKWGYTMLWAALMLLSIVGYLMTGSAVTSIY